MTFKMDKPTLVKWMSKFLAIIFIGTASYDFFSSAISNEDQLKNYNMPEALRKIKVATSFDDSVVGEAASRSDNYKAYAEAVDQIQGLTVDDLNNVLESGTPAGKIYAAVLLHQSSKVGHNLSFDKLLNDKSAVAYKSGCKVMNTTVGEIAKTFVDTGSYHNFKYSMFCKLTAPVNNGDSSSKPSSNLNPAAKPTSGVNPAAKPTSGVNPAAKRSSGVNPAPKPDSEKPKKGDSHEREQASTVQSPSALKIAYQNLLTSTAVSHYQQGDSNQPSQLWLYFQILKKQGAGARAEVLQLLESKNPNARVYGLVLMKEINASEGAAQIKKSLDDKEKVLFSSGCTREETTVSELASRISKGDSVIFLEKPAT